MDNTLTGGAHGDLAGLPNLVCQLRPPLLRVGDVVPWRNHLGPQQRQRGPLEVVVRAEYVDMPASRRTEPGARSRARWRTSHCAEREERHRPHASQARELARHVNGVADVVDATPTREHRRRPGRLPG